MDLSACSCLPVGEAWTDPPAKIYIEETKQVHRDWNKQREGNVGQRGAGGLAVRAPAALSTAGRQLCRGRRAVTEQPWGRGAAGWLAHTFKHGSLCPVPNKPFSPRAHLGKVLSARQAVSASTAGYQFPQHIYFKRHFSSEEMRATN